MGRSRARRGRPRDEKVCTVCGRRMVWRAKWAADWDAVTTCSAACRRAGVGALDRDLEAEILNLLGRRAAGATICPSEAAREVSPDEWRELMERARRAGRRLAARGEIVWTQKGHPVDPSTARGPVRFRSVRRPS